MLVSYTVENYRSFYDSVTLDFRVLATEGEKTCIDENPYVVKINDEYISKLCLLYGANGAGKSNLLRSLEMLFFGMVKNLFDPNMIKGQDKNTSFEIVFYTNDEDKNSKILHTYKLILDNKNKKVSEETFSTNDEIIFKRENSRIIKSSEEMLENQTIADNTTTFEHIYNTSELRENKDIGKIWFNFYSIAMPAMPAFKYNNIMPSKAENIIKFIHDYFVENGLWFFYKHLLFLADTGMEDIAIKDKKPKKELFSKRGEWISRFDDTESDGTKTYSMHLVDIVRSIWTNSLSIHDEFNGLQSELVEMIITLFQRDRFSDIPNSTNQIIISTHDTNLMEIPNLLMNHVWFVDKKDNMSELYSASDFEEVAKENLVEKYKKNRLRAKFHSNAYRVSKYFLKDDDNDSNKK